MNEIIENETASLGVFLVFAIGLRHPDAARRRCSSRRLSRRLAVKR